MPQHKPKISVSIISLGCPKNLVDTEKFMGLLDPHTFSLVPPTQATDVCIINTCCFINDAKKESIDTILEIAQKKKDGVYKKIIVTGCLTQRYRDELPELFPEVDVFVEIGRQKEMGKIVLGLFPDRRGDTMLSPLIKGEYMDSPLHRRQQTTPFHTKFIKLSEGCSHQCSFCIIPQIRGPLVSRKPNNIVTEINEGLQNGVKEFNLIAQDLNEYGRDLTPRHSLTSLLEKVDSIEGRRTTDDGIRTTNNDFWLRLLYLYPLHFPDKLIKLMARSQHILPYVDIPLQHISDNQLKLMRRGSSSKYIYRLIDKLKTAMPDIVLRTTFLVGHPGETQKDFEQLMRFVKNTEFDRVGVFTYSREEQTPAFSMKNSVSEKKAQNRKDELLKLQQKISLKKNRQWVGKTVKTLIEGPSKESDLLWQGRFYGQAPDIDGVILINDGTAPMGSFADVKINDAFEYDLLGKIIKGSNPALHSCARTFVSS